MFQATMPCITLASRSECSGKVPFSIVAYEIETAFGCQNSEKLQRHPSDLDHCVPEVPVTWQPQEL